VTIKLLSWVKRIEIANSPMTKGRSLIYSQNNNSPSSEPVARQEESWAIWTQRFKELHYLLK
jgi:hypothetical protein